MSDHEHFDSAYDFNHDGKLDGYEYSIMEEDDDYLYLNENKLTSNASHNIRSSNNGRGLSVGKSIFVGLIIASIMLAILNVDDAEGLGVFLWGIISAIAYFGTNQK